MWPFSRNKFKKLKREDVVNSIIELTKREEAMEQSILDSKVKIQELYAKGKAEKDPTIRILYAKKINFTKDEIKNNTQRAMYLLYNLKLLNQLKTTMDDDQFISTVGKESLSDLLGDQKNLAKFLNKALNRKIAAENVLTEADDIFNEVSNTYEPSDRIFGVNSKDDELLAMFETDDAISVDSGFEETSETDTKKEADKE